MHQSFNRIQFLKFLKLYWPRIFVVALLLFIHFKQHVSFQFQLSAPSYFKQSTLSAPSGAEHSVSIWEQLYDRFSEQKLSSFFGFKGSSEKDAFHRLKRIRDKKISSFLNKYANTARAMMQETEIPASIIVATALLQSTAGTKAVTKDANNLFGLTCSKNWEGQSIKIEQICYRSYPSYTESFSDFYRFLATGPYPPENHPLQHDDLLGWANLIGMSALSGEPNFPDQLNKTIQMYGLDRLDF